MGNASRDDNNITTLIAVSNVDGSTPITLYADPTTHRLLVSAATSVGGSDTQVQFNDGGSIAGDSGFTYNKTTDTITLLGDVKCEDLLIEDSDASHYLTITTTSNLTANRTLTLVPGNSSRTITLSGDPTLADWFDQSVKVASSPTFASVTSSGDLSGKVWIAGPEDAQAITAVSDTITANTATHFDLSSDADYVMTSTPTIANGTDGQIIYVHNTGSFTISFQDESALPDSDILVNGADGILRPDAIMTLLYDTATGGWHVVSNPNSSIAGANADVIAVRNTSGSAIASGKVVYITGFNTGQGRPTIALADADDITKMPSIGFTAATINNNANGDVVAFGSLIGVVATNTASVNDGVWIGTTPGEVVFTRPNIDLIQRIGTVTRSNASGNILVTGAGRSNDVPIISVFGGGEGGTTTPTDGVVRAPNLSGGTNVVGANLTISAGQGTGTGDVGQIIFQTPRVAGSGSSVQTLTTLLTLDEDTVTFAGPVTGITTLNASAANINGALVVTIDSGTTNAVTDVANFASTSTGTPAAGIGVGILFNTETAAGNTEIGGAIRSITTDVDPTNEDFDMVFYTMLSGDTATEWFRGKSDLSATFAGAVTMTGGGVLGVDGTINTLQLTEKASIQLDPAGGADGDYSGTTFTGTGGATIAFGRLVYLLAGDSEWYEADADAVATSGIVALAMTVTATTNGNPVTLLQGGIIRADASFPALTIGAPVYASVTPGAIQVAAPSGTDDVVRIVGYAITADEIIFNPSPDHITIV